MIFNASRKLHSGAVHPQVRFWEARNIRFLLSLLTAMASVSSSYGGNITVNWSAADLTGVALAGSGNEYGSVNGVPFGDLMEIGTFTNAPSVGSSSLSNFIVFGTGHVGDEVGLDGFWADSTGGNEAGFAHAQIYIVVVNTTTVAAASQVGIFYVSDAVNPNWRFPASTDVVTQTSIDIEDLLNNPGSPSATLATGAQIIYGSGPVYDAVDSLSFLQLQPTNSAALPGTTTNSWSSTASGKWETGANWSSGQAPATSDPANFITNANTKTVTIDATTSGSFPNTLTISNLTVSAPLGSVNTLSLNDAGTTTPLHILNSFTIDTNGSVQVVNSALRVDSVSGGTFTINGGNLSASSFTNTGTLTVTGGGTLNLQGTWANSGVISGNVSAINLGGTFTTAGIGTLKNPGGTNFLNGTLVNTNATLALTATTGSFYLQGGAIQGGTLTASGGAQLLVPSGYNATLDGVTLNTPLTITNAATLSVTTNGLTLNSTLTLASTGNGTYLNLNGTQTLGGTGQVVLAGSNPYGNYLQEYGGGTITIGAGITVHGAGSVYGDCNNPLVNLGTISADLNGYQLYVSCFTNAGRMSALNGGTLQLNGNWSNGGIISNNASTVNLGGTFTPAGIGTLKSIGGTVILSGTITGCGTINGNLVAQGSVNATCGGAVNFTGSVTNDGNVTALNGTVLQFFGPVVNNGAINATGGNVFFYSTLSGGGSVTLPPTNSWTAGSGKWETGTNWSSARAPSLNDSADLITNAGSKVVTIDAATSASYATNLTIANLIISGPLNTTNTLFLNGAGSATALAVQSTVTIKSGGSIFVTNSAVQVNGASGGAIAVDGQLTMMAGGTVMVASNLLVGSSNTASLVTIAGGNLYVTNATHSALTEVRSGSLVLTDGVYFTDSLLVTNTGANFFNNGGTFTITGLDRVDQGTQTVASGVTQLYSNLLVGTSANSTGTVNVTGGSLIITNASTAIGTVGIGIMIVSNGTVATTQTDIAPGTNSQGVLMLQDNSAMTISSNLTVSSGSGSTGTVSMTGGQLVVTNGVIGIGNNGTVTSDGGVGRVIVSDSVLVASSIVLGNSAGRQCDLILSDGGLISDGGCPSGTNCQIVINSLGFTQTNGTVNACATPMELGVTTNSDCTVSGDSANGQLSVFVRRL